MTARNQNGFTLIELLIAIGLLAIVSMYAVPLFSDLMGKYRLKGATESLFSGLMFARSESIRLNKEVHISFTRTSATTWCWGVEMDAACDCTIAGDCDIKEMNQDEYLNIEMLNESLAGNSFFYDPIRGTATNGYIGFTNAKGQTTRVAVSLLGRVKMCIPPGGLLTTYPDC